MVWRLHGFVGYNDLCSFSLLLWWDLCKLQFGGDGKLLSQLLFSQLAILKEMHLPEVPPFIIVLSVLPEQLRAGWTW